MTAWQRIATIGLLLLGLMPLSAAQAAQGLYSMKALIDAPVYAAGRDKPIGEVDNVIVDEQMKITGIVIDTDGDIAGLDGRELYVEVGRFSVETINGGNVNSVRYRVRVHGTVAQISQYPVVDNGWWQTAKQAASQVWDKTKSTARSAWDATKDATSRALDATKDATRDVIDSIREKTK